MCALLYVYRRNASDSARDLADALQVNARRISDLAKAHFNTGVRAGDFVVCWGDAYTGGNGIRVLNGGAIRTKYEDARILKEARVATIEVLKEKPVARPAVAVVDPLLALKEDAEDRFEAFISAPWRRGPVFERGLVELSQFITQVTQAARVPAPVAQAAVAVQGEWIGRKNSHVGGADILQPTANADYYSKREMLTEEYRLHIFQGKSIRAGVKVKREGFERTAHEWVRSFDGGWRIKYDEFKSKKAMRELAVSAVAALGLDFGAVDMGKRADGSYIVLEVNRAPGVEGGTTETYARAIEKWTRGEEV